MKYIYFFVISILILVHSVVADTFKSDKEFKKFTDSVMKKAVSGDFGGAFNTMQPYTVIPKAEFESVLLQFNAQTDQYLKRYGKSVGYEFISKDKLGQSLIRIIYIEKREKHVLPWTFYFYKSPKGWILKSFIWTNQLKTLFSP